jgi:hypothetical protein
MALSSHDTPGPGTGKSGIPASSGVRPCFLPLQAWQLATQFSIVVNPPLALGRTWSTTVAGPPQYRQAR